MLPEQQRWRKDAFEAEIDNMSLLMYHIKAKNLKMFLDQDANIALLRFFAANDGLAKTDPLNKKPLCRKTALAALLM